MHVDLLSETHHESLIDLLCELHSFYNANSVTRRATVREHLLENFLAAGSPHRLVVASSDDGEVVGLAAITLVYSLVDFAADKRKQCQLKELYVKSAKRSMGVGRLLLSWVARFALDNGCSRIDWPVNASNARGLSFYEGLGARRVVERLSYRLTEPNLSQLANVNNESVT
jgi:GNAT superfamily N-acetyltransferase